MCLKVSPARCMPDVQLANCFCVCECWALRGLASAPALCHGCFREKWIWGELKVTCFFLEHIRGVEDWHWFGILGFQRLAYKIQFLKYLVKSGWARIAVNRYSACVPPCGNGVIMWIISSFGRDKRKRLDFASWRFCFVTSRTSLKLKQNISLLDTPLLGVFTFTLFAASFWWCVHMYPLEI